MPSKTTSISVSPVADPQFEVCSANLAADQLMSHAYYRLGSILV